MSGALPRKGILLLTSLLLLAWPGVIWLGLAHNSLRWLLPLMALLLYLRLRQTRRQAGPLRIVTQVVALAGIALCVASTLLKTHQLLLFYPLVVNAVMLAAFGGYMALWTAWNGMIAYLLIGALMAGEWLVRRRVMKRESL